MWKKNKTLVLLIAAAILIKVFSLFPDAVERYYTHGLYVYTSAIQRALLVGYLLALATCSMG